ncbi:MAG: hypothetical protein WBD36_12225, partial [Bacteroidota bacterium]
MKTRIDLHSEWQVRSLDANRASAAVQPKIKEWMRATVPGTIHTDLMANMVIPDPFYRMNENEVQWVDSQQWIYHTEFNVTDRVFSETTIDLVAEGLDTYAHLSINGKKLGATSNMFVEHRFSVKSFLRPGRNVLEILFDSPTARSKKLEAQHGKLKVALEPHRVYIRKAQYAFGWDWGPRLTTSGIWKDIYLEAYSHPVLSNPVVKVRSVKGNKAGVECAVEITGKRTAGLNLRVTIQGGVEEVTATTAVRSGREKLHLNIAHPKLWWPHGSGDQPMYR